MTKSGFNIADDPEVENTLRRYANLPEKTEEAIEEEEEERKKNKEAADKLREQGNAALDDDGNVIDDQLDDDGKNKPKDELEEKEDAV